MNPTVSIIIPCYNDETTIDQTLQSLLNQTFFDWEAIVVNDGATDDSVQIVRKYQTRDSRIKQIDQTNQGLPAARNTGLSMAKGEFVNFLDADDILLPNMLQNIVYKLKKNPSLEAAYCGWIYSDAKMQDLSWVVTPRLEGQLFGELAHHNLFPCHSVALRRETFKKVGLFDCSLRHCHDWDLWLRVAKAGGRFGCVSSPLVIYRMSPGSMSRNASAFFEAGKEVIRRGHSPDHRVKKPAAEFSEGCKCSTKEVMLGWCIHCIGFAITQGDVAQASRLLETVVENGDSEITPQKMGLMRHSLWFAAAVPRGDWVALWPRVSRQLLQFLLVQEERLDRPGFAMQSLVEIIDWHKKMSGRELLSELLKRIVKRVSCR
ncbi:MAG: glycosyltransferase [Planctomycetota bacterium]